VSTTEPQHLSEDEFWQRFGKLEHEGLDFKEKPPKDLATDLAAMAMTTGGEIVLGVTDDRRFVGCPLSQDVLDSVSRAAASVDVPVLPQELAVAAYRLTAIRVDEVRGRIVTTSNGRLMRRVGSDNVPLRGDALGRFVRERTLHPAEDDLVPNFGPDQLDVALLNQILLAEGRPRVRSREAILRALVDLKLALPSVSGTAVPTRAALVLLGNSPTDAHTGFRVQFVRRRGSGSTTSSTSERSTISGPLPQVVDEVAARIEASRSDGVETVVGLRREPVPPYPRAALREGLLNALAHRDYGLSGATVDVTVWDDALEIRSPGSLPGHMTLDNLREEHYSRNPRIMNVLKTLRLVDEYGEGVDRLYEEMESRLLPDPTWSATASSVTLKLYSSSQVSVEDQVWLSLLSSLSLSALERRVLVLAHNDEWITRRAVSSVVPSANVGSLLASMVTKGLLHREGTRGGGRYRLGDEIVARAGARGLEAQNRKREQLRTLMAEQGSVSVAEGVDLLHESPHLVRTLLRDLVAHGQAEGRGNTRARRYHAL